MHPVIVRSNGSIIDHIGVGAPDFEAALADIEKQLGVRPLDLGTYGAQRRAAASLGEQAFLEVLGPATDDSAQLDPMMRLAAGLKGPAVMFWYVGVSDFDAYGEHAARVGHPLQAHQHVQRDGYDYWIAGPDGIAHVPVTPWIIQWIARPSVMASWPQLGKLTRFELEHPNPSAMQDILSALGTPMPVSKGDAPRVVLSLDNNSRAFTIDGQIAPIDFGR